MRVDIKGGVNTIHGSHATFQTQHIQSMSVMELVLGRPTLARCQKNSLAFGDQIPDVRQPKYFHGSRAYALIVLGEEEKYKFGKLA